MNQTLQQSDSFLIRSVLPKVARVSVLTTAIGILLKCCLVRTGDIFLILGLSILAIYFIIISTISSPLTEEHNASLKKFHSIIAQSENISVAVVLCGALFKFFVWDGYTVLLPIGLFVLASILIYRINRGYYNRPALAVLLFGTTVFLIPITRFINFFHRNDPQLVTLLILQSHDPGNPKIKQAVYDYLSRVPKPKKHVQ